MSQIPSLTMLYCTIFQVLTNNGCAVLVSQPLLSLYPSYLPNLNNYSCLTYVHVLSTSCCLLFLPCSRWLWLCLECKRAYNWSWGHSSVGVVYQLTRNSPASLPNSQQLYKWSTTRWIPKWTKFQWIICIYIHPARYLLLCSWTHLYSDYSSRHSLCTGSTIKCG